MMRDKLEPDAIIGLTFRDHHLNKSILLYKIIERNPYFEVISVDSEQFYVSTMSLSESK